jgi:hypothetical protein
MHHVDLPAEYFRTPFQVLADAKCPPRGIAVSRLRLYCVYCAPDDDRTMLFGAELHVN